MKLVFKATLVNLLFGTAFTAAMAANSTLGQYNQQQALTNSQNLVQYLQNLAGYLGYDITQPATANNKALSHTLLNISSTQKMQLYLFNTFLGAIPVNAFSTALSQFLPAEVGSASALNAFANNTFNSQNYNNPSGQQQGMVGVSSLMDQPSYQSDPVSQAVLNVLGTPNYSYCMSYDSSSWTQNCSLLYENLVSANVIGPLPTTYQYYTYNYNQQFLSQLNSNSLTAPLIYSTQNPSADNTSSASSSSKDTGLTAQNQAQEAANFIRYASGATTPIKLPKQKDYDTLYNQANPPSGSNVSLLQQKQAQGILSNYFASLRTYAAQNSVGLSNLYYIMSKRLPQNQGSSKNATPMSQAMSEFNMATWRLFNPDLSASNQWVNQLNDASPATVEKEIATLLAEINYQMYLDRQIQERILLTNSIMLIQNTKQTLPSADFASQGNPGSN